MQKEEKVNPDIAKAMELKRGHGTVSRSLRTDGQGSGLSRPLSSIIKKKSILVQLLEFQAYSLADLQIAPVGRDLPEEPRYWGPWKSRVVKAIANDGATGTSRPSSSLVTNCSLECS
ncbi:MAG: hypothetical protein JSW05_00240 [Candidatus Thorarchaeota archaeon]|nr:MAG: hypothetical protein JSW05_00240 [Candidatus Thorarchaeota archaeon]